MFDLQPNHLKNNLISLSPLQENDFDLLLTDLSMPGMDGIDLVKKIRQELKKLKIMFITGFSAVAIEANETDFDNEAEVVSKPFHLNDLNARIEKMLAEKPE